MQTDIPNRHIPQDGKRLKALRQIKGLSQAGLAQALQTLIKPYMKHGFVIQQPDIARIELEKSTLDVPELLGYSQFFGTHIDDLLKPHFRSLHKNAFCFMPLLRIGRETLALLQAGVSMENSIRYFYDEVQKRSPEDAEAVLQNVNQDMQDILIE